MLMAFRWGGPLILCALLMSCGSDRTRTLQVRPGIRVCLIEPVVDCPDARAAYAVCRALYPDARCFTADRCREAFAQSLADDWLVLAPACRYFPLEYSVDLHTYIGSGGRIVLQGRNPFQAGVLRFDGQWLPRNEWTRQMAASARPARGVGSIQSWRHRNEIGQLSGDVMVAHDLDVTGWSAVDVRTELIQRDAMRFDVASQAGIPSHADALVFYARGDERTSRLVVECTTSTGTWYATIPVTPDWRPCVLHMGDFIPIPGFAVSSESRLSLSAITRISAGLDMCLAPQMPGPVHYGLSDFRFVDTGLPDGIPHAPALTGIPAGAACADTRINTLHDAAGNTVWEGPDLVVQSPRPLPRGWGALNERDSRWIPLIEAVSADDHSVYPVSMNIRPDQAAWAWIAVDPVEGDVSNVLSLLVRRTVQRMLYGAFFIRGGAARFSWEAGRHLYADAAWVADTPVRLSAELFDEQGERIRRATCNPKEAVTEASFDLGVLRAAGGHPMSCTLRLTLRDAAPPGRELDRIEQPLLVFPIHPAHADVPILTSGARFTAGHLRTFLLGTEYHLSSEDDGLEAKRFVPARLKADLDTLKKHDLNVIRVSYTRLSEAPQLRYLLHEARVRSFRVMLNMPDLSPLNYNLDRAGELLSAAHLEQAPEVFSLLLADAPSFGDIPSEQHLDKAWREWMVEQYGSEKHAEEVLGMPLGNPLDYDMAADDPRSAVCRRFLADYISRRLGYIRRFLEDSHITTLLGMSYGLTDPSSCASSGHLLVDPVMGNTHLDWMGLHPLGLWNGTEPLKSISVAADYIRHVAGVKPLLMNGIGVPVLNPATPAELVNQQRIFTDSFNLAGQTAASGCLAASGAQGYLPGADWNILDAAGRWRPVGAVFQRYARRLRRETTLPHFVRDARSSRLGMMAYIASRTGTDLSHQGNSAVARANRPASRAYRSLGDRPWLAPAPPEGLNAEWGRITINGKPFVRSPNAILDLHVGDRVELELINTGERTWRASTPDRQGTTWLAVRNDRGRRRRMRLPQRISGAHALIQWNAPYQGNWEMRPELLGFGGFGERLHIHVSAP